MAKIATIEKPTTRAALEGEIAKLGAEARALTHEAATRYEKGERPYAVQSSYQQIRTAALTEVMGEAGVTTGRSLTEVEHRRKVIEEIIHIRRGELSILLHREKDEVGRDLEREWNSNIRETIELLSKLQKLVSRQAGLRDEWCVRVGLDVSPVCYEDGQRLVMPGSQIVAFLNTARRLGLI